MAIDNGTWTTFGTATIAGSLTGMVAGQTYDGGYTNATYPLVGLAAAVQLTDPKTAQADFMAVGGKPGAGTPNCYGFRVANEMLMAFVQSNYVPTILRSVKYDPTQHIFLRISSPDGKTVLFSTSPGGAWQAFTGCPASIPGPLFVQLMGSANSAAGTQAVKWQNFQLATPAPPVVTPIAPAPTPAPAQPSPIPNSGYGGTEPAATDAPLAGIKTLSWSGYLWEIENWGTSGSGWPDAAQAALIGSDLSLSIGQLPDGRYCGAELDSVRGDRALTGNSSTWGYGAYRWVFTLDATIAPGLVLGLFTYWATSKGGPQGQNEIDIEFSNWSVPGAPEFTQCGYYANDGTDISSGIPGGNHVMVPGSQLALPAGGKTITAEFEWHQAAIEWRLWYSADTSGAPDDYLAIREGDTYSYTEPYGGNLFAGKAHIPQTGGQQVIMNLWSQGQSLPQMQRITFHSFTYTPMAG